MGTFNHPVQVLEILDPENGIYNLDYPRPLFAVLLRSSYCLLAFKGSVNEYNTLNRRDGCRIG